MNCCKHIYGIDRWQDENFGLADNPRKVSPGSEFSFCPFCGKQLNMASEAQQPSDGYHGRPAEADF
jgi:hypothetical protein